MISYEALLPPGDLRGAGARGPDGASQSMRGHGDGHGRARTSDPLLVRSGCEAQHGA
jgi:hypothetical protein